MAWEGVGFFNIEDMSILAILLYFTFTESIFGACRLFAQFCTKPMHYVKNS